MNRQIECKKLPNPAYTARQNQQLGKHVLERVVVDVDSYGCSMKIAELVSASKEDG